MFSIIISPVNEIFTKCDVNSTTLYYYRRIQIVLTSGRQTLESGTYIIYNGSTKGTHFFNYTTTFIAEALIMYRQQ